MRRYAYNNLTPSLSAIMLGFGEREKGPPERKQRWAFIELDDFKCTSFWTYLAYGWLWFMGFVGVAVYAVDTFTAINLLAFDQWSSQVKPQIPLKYSKWIFSICIFVSWALLIYEWFRAIRVIKKDGVAASYMDPIAASLQSMRSRGWKRFLVYTELTRSKKGTDYVAFFVYFGFQSAIRVIVAEGPRQFVNAITLYAVMQAQLINDGKTDKGNSQFDQFFQNIGTIADQNYQQAIIYASMLFTLVIWVFSALCLIGAGVLYIVFLWHYIPQRDGRLRIYCRRKIDRRLEKIVVERFGTAIADDAKRIEKEEMRAELKRQKTGDLPLGMGIKRAPTLPDIGEGVEFKDDTVSLNRQDTKSTVSTLPLYSSRPPTRQDAERPPLPGMPGDRPDMPGRTATMGSARSKASFESNAPLLPNAGFAGGDGRVPSPAPTYYSRNNSSASVPYRTDTQSTQASQRSFTPITRMDTPASQQRSFTPMSANSSRPPPGQRFPVRSNTGFSYDEPHSAVSEISPVDSFGRPPMPPPLRQNTAPPMRQDSDMSYFSRSGTAPPMDRRPTYGSVNVSSRGPSTMPVQQPTHARQGSFSRLFTSAYARDQPTPPANCYEMASKPPTSASNFGEPQPAAGSLYIPFNPGMHGSESTPITQGPRRNITVGGPGPERGDYFSLPQRNVASHIHSRADSSYGSILDDYGASTPNEPLEYQPIQRPYPPRGPSRANTAGPDTGRW